MARPTWAVFGAGAMGALFFSRLGAVAGIRAQLVHRPRALGPITGILEETADGRRRTAVPEAGAGAPVDVALVLVKAFATRPVGAAVARVLAPTGTVVTLQNGFGNREVLRDALAAAGKPGALVLAGTTTEASLMVDPRPPEPRFQHKGRGETVLDAAGFDRRAEAVAQVLRQAGFETRLTNNVDRALWTKLVINAAINPFTALRGCTNGELLALAPDDKELIHEVIRNGCDAAAVHGVNLDPVAMWQVVQNVCAATSGNRSSMLVDVAAGRPTEIDAICGPIEQAIAGPCAASECAARVRELGAG